MMVLRYIKLKRSLDIVNLADILICVEHILKCNSLL